jgi:uncharacterized glyoxalase superfamily protein PhnB
MWVTSLRDPDGYRLEFESPTDVPEGTVFGSDATAGDGDAHLSAAEAQEAVAATSEVPVGDPAKEAAPRPQSSHELRFAIPVLHVTGSVAAQEFYCDRLGFRQQFAYRPDEARPDPCYMGVIRDGVQLHLSSFAGDGVAGAVVYVAVGDVDALHAEFARKGVPVDTGPIDQTWGTREMYVKDSDRNSIRFVQESGG